MKALFLILLFASSLFAKDYDASHLNAITRGEPSTLIEGCVSALTGDYYISQADLIVPGKCPIVHQRQYISSQSFRRGGGWLFHGTTHAGYCHMTDRFHVLEPDGTELIYELDKEATAKHIKPIENPLKDIVGTTQVCNAHYKPKTPSHIKEYKVSSWSYQKAITNCSRGQISARNDLTNNRLVLQKKGNHFHVYASDGSVRYYKHSSKVRARDLKRNFYLQWERHPNGDITHYEINPLIDLGYFRNPFDVIQKFKKIYTTDASKTLIYSTAKYHDPKGFEHSNFSIKTTLGKELHWHYKPLKHLDKEFSRHFENTEQDDLQLLMSVNSSDQPEERLEYY